MAKYESGKEFLEECIYLFSLICIGFKIKEITNNFEGISEEEKALYFSEFPYKQGFEFIRKTIEKMIPLSQERLEELAEMAYKEAEAGRSMFWVFQIWVKEMREVNNEQFKSV